MDAIIDKTSDLEQSIVSIKSNFNVLFSDREVILSRIDLLNETNGSLAAVFSKFADLANKNNTLTKQLENTLLDFNVSPDLSLLKEEVSVIFNSIRGIEERLQKMISLPALRASPPSSVPCAADTARDEPSPSSNHSLPIPHQRSLTISRSASYAELPHLPTVDGQNTPPHFLDVSPPGSQHNPVAQLGSLPVAQPSVDLNFNPRSIPGCGISWIPKEAVETTSLYIGRCETSTTAETIKNFVSTQLRIPFHSVRCRKLISPSRPLEDYSFVSFKVDIPSVHEISALSHHWPVPSKVSLFQHRNRGKDGVPSTRPLHSKNDHNSPSPRRI